MLLEEKHIKQYSGYLSRWTNFCSEWEADPFSAPVNICLDFLVSLYEKELSYSSLNTAHSAISAIHGGCGTSPLINHFMKGIYNLRPGLPRYTCTYDIKTVLDCLDSIAVDQESLKCLSRKLALLLLLLTGQRVQILKKLDISNVHFTDTK